MTFQLRQKGTVLALGAALSFAISLPAQAEKWDMPLAYSATNYHSENAAQLRQRAVTRGLWRCKLEIVTHASEARCYKGGEIFRAVRTGQAPDWGTPDFGPGQ